MNTKLIVFREVQLGAAPCIYTRSLESFSLCLSSFLLRPLPAVSSVHRVFSVSLCSSGPVFPSLLPVFHSSERLPRVPSREIPWASVSTQTTMDNEHKMSTERVRASRYIVLPSPRARVASRNGEPPVAEIASRSRPSVARCRYSGRSFDSTAARARECLFFLPFY